LIACRAKLRIGRAGRQIHISDRLIELACREVVSLAFDPIVEMIACRQWRLQQVAAEQFMNEQRRNIALPRRWVARRPLARRRQRPCLRSAL
jgi:hypothetical protein